MPAFGRAAVRWIPGFYSYAYPSPPLSDDEGEAGGPFFSKRSRRIHPAYDAVRTADDPDRALLDFLQSTYRQRQSLRNGIARHSNARWAGPGWLREG